MTTNVHVHLSPHFDDVALSTGATIAAAVRAGVRVVMLTVFAGPPAPGPASPFARAFHRLMGASDGRDVWRARRAEDQRASEILGAHPRWLEWPDAIWRGAPDDARDDPGARPASTWYYSEPAALFGAVHPSEHTLAADIAHQVHARIRAERPDFSRLRVFAPLGIGGHVDHVLVHRAGWRLRDAGLDVWFYEDFPYAEASQASQASQAASHGCELTPRLVTVTHDDVEARIRAIQAYPSQLAHVFGEVESIPARVRRAASRYAAYPSAAADRFWVPGTPDQKPDHDTDQYTSGTKV